MNKKIMLSILVLSLSFSAISCSSEKNEEADAKEIELNKIEEDRENRKKEKNKEESDISSKLWINEVTVQLEILKNIAYNIKEIDYTSYYTETYGIINEGADKLLLFIKGMEEVFKFEGTVEENQELLNESMKLRDEGYELMNKANETIQEEIEINKKN